MIDILVPTLGRADVLSRFVDNVEEVTAPGRCDLWFVLDHADRASREALESRSVNLVYHDGTYPVKINAGYRLGHQPFVLPTADDVVFHEGWLDPVLPLFHRNPLLQVLGTDDLSPATADRSHATMPIIRRHYVDARGAAWGETGTVFHEGYRHNFCETELWQLASHRGVTAWAEGAVIEHLHPAWGKRAEDATDEKGNKQGWEGDEALFRKRREQWSRF